MSNSKMHFTGTESNLQTTSEVVDSGVAVAGSGVGVVVGSAVPRVESEDGSMSHHSLVGVVTDSGVKDGGDERGITGKDPPGMNFESEPSSSLFQESKGERDLIGDDGTLGSNLPLTTWTWHASDGAAARENPPPRRARSLNNMDGFEGDWWFDEDEDNVELRAAVGYLRLVDDRVKEISGKPLATAKASDIWEVPKQVAEAMSKLGVGKCRSMPRLGREDRHLDRAFQRLAVGKGMESRLPKTPSSKYPLRVGKKGQPAIAKTLMKKLPDDQFPGTAFGDKPSSKTQRVGDLFSGIGKKLKLKFSKPKEVKHSVPEHIKKGFAEKLMIAQAEMHLARRTVDETLKPSSSTKVILRGNSSPKTSSDSEN